MKYTREYLATHLIAVYYTSPEQHREIKKLMGENSGGADNSGLCTLCWEKSRGGELEKSYTHDPNKSIDNNYYKTHGYQIITYDQLFSKEPEIINEYQIF